MVRPEMVSNSGLRALHQIGFVPTFDCMATVAAEVDIAATPQEILAVVEDFPAYPQWLSSHLQASVDSRHSDGRPACVNMIVTAMGMVDEQVVHYDWTEDRVVWTLVSSRQQRRQDGALDLAAVGGVTQVKYLMEIEPLMRIPEFLLRPILKKTAVMVTEGLRTRVEAVRC
jgi:ribosome-associated toxin RatA of RatAB toxin-antitoxin module